MGRLRTNPGLGSQARGCTSPLAERFANSRAAPRRKGGSAPLDVVFGVVLVPVIACALLPPPGSAQAKAKAAAEPQSVAQAVNSPAEQLGILHLPSNDPPVDPLVAAKDDPFFPSRARTDCG